MKHHFYGRSVFAAGLLVVLCSVGVVRGQWMSETFALSNGWNAIYLRGTPWPADLDTQFAGLPIQAVHRSYLHYDTAQFSGSVGDLATRGTEWVVWYPPDSRNRVLTTLWNLGGNNAYLVQCSSDCTWTVKGMPVIPWRIWLPNNWNFVGLPVTDSRAVTFTEFFQNATNIDVSPDPSGGKVYRVLPSGEQEDITSRTALTAVSPREGYWVMTQGLSAFIGTVFAHATLGSLRYPPNTSISSFTIRNEYIGPQQVSVTLVTSEEPPPGAPDRVGDVPLMHFDYGADGGSNGWAPLIPGTPLTKTLASNQQWAVALAVNRSAMSPPPAPNATWQSILEIRDEGGTLIRVPVVAEYGGADSYNALWPAGLWVGEVTLNKVTQLADGSVSPAQPTAGELAFRLIVHVGTDGQTRLLQQTVLEWAQSVNAGITNSFYRLHVSDRGLVPSAENSRVSSVGFPYALNVLLEGDLLGELAGTYVVGYDDPSHPFKHIYHPNHDNRNVGGEMLPEGVESYTVHNEVRLVTDTLQPYSPSATLWNPEEELTGRYFQTMNGLRKQPIEVEGRFTLRRVSRTGVLE